MFVRKPTIKKYYVKDREEILALVPRTPRFSNHVVKGGMKTTRKGSPAARKPIVNKTKNTLEITKTIL